MRVQMPESSHERAPSGQVNTQLQSTAIGFNNFPAELTANTINNAPTVKDRFPIQRTFTLHRADISCGTPNKNQKRDDSPDRDSMFKRLTSIEKDWNTGCNQTRIKPSADTCPELQEKAKYEPSIQVPESRPFLNRFQGCQRTKSMEISKPHFQQQTLEGADHQAVRLRISSVISFGRLSVSRGGVLSKKACGGGSIQKQSICSSASSIESFFQESCIFVLPVTRDPRLKPKNNANNIKTFDSAVGTTKTVFHGIGSKLRLMAEVRGSPTINFLMKKKKTEGSKMEAQPLATKAGLIEAEQK